MSDPFAQIEDPVLREEVRAYVEKVMRRHFWENLGYAVLTYAVAVVIGAAGIALWHIRDVDALFTLWGWQ